MQKAAEMVKKPGTKFVIINYHCKFPDVWSQYPLASGYRRSYLLSSAYAGKLIVFHVPNTDTNNSHKAKIKF
jgi:hypothetical protein